MIMKFIKNLQKGYHRPVTLPIWKWVIVWILWVIALIGYIFAMFITPWILTIGIIFQILGLYLPYIWDTGKWKNTEQAKVSSRNMEINL